MTYNDLQSCSSDENETVGAHCFIRRAFILKFLWHACLSKRVNLQTKPKQSHGRQLERSQPTKTKKKSQMILLGAFCDLLLTLFNQLTIPSDTDRCLLKRIVAYVVISNCPLNCIRIKPVTYTPNITLVMSLLIERK